MTVDLVRPPFPRRANPENHSAGFIVARLNGAKRNLEQKPPFSPRNLARRCAERGNCGVNCR